MANKILIGASLLGARFQHHGQLKEDVQEVDALVDWHHIDVMDGKLVETPSALDESHVAVVRQVSQKPIDAHLMVAHPEPMIARYAEAGANLITMHYEAFVSPDGALDAKRLDEAIRQIKKAGCFAGLSVKPRTPASVFSDELLKNLDLVLVMTVEPGKAGQAFMPGMLPKITEFSHRLNKLNPSALLQVDGGVGPQNARPCIDAGANFLIAASAIFKAKDKKAAVAAMRNPV
ncbi:MAG: ribulose-phosphate 3-epimerase [Candidatus Micrarchaeia archaeon]